MANRRITIFFVCLRRDNCLSIVYDLSETANCKGETRKVQRNQTARLPHLLPNAILFFFMDPASGSNWLWLGFSVFIIAMLSLDLGLFNRKAHTIKYKEAWI